MWKINLRQVLAVWVTVAMLLSSTAPFTAQVALAETTRSQSVAGTLTGGEFAKIWLGLVPETKGQTLKVITEWDRATPESHGLGFFLLDQEGLNRVLNGSSNVHDANLSAGSKLSPESPDNQLGAVIQATGDSYTIVLFNDSPTDANFTLNVTNGFVLDDSAQVRDLSAKPTPVATEEGGDAAAEPTEEAAAAATETAPAATAAPAATEAPAAATAEATPEATPVPSGTPGVVRAQELRGELPNMNDQQYFALEPSERDGAITLTYSFDPQDSSELARRTNFWVLTEDDFRRFADASVNVVLSEVAIAAGSQAPGLQANQRQAKFTASGFGPYVVIVYNNANVPATYTLRVDGGILVDDAGQSLTAQRPAVGAIGASGDVTATVDAGDATTTTATTTTTTTTTTTAGSTREGEPGGTYTVAAGDTLSLIARDIYGDVGLWEELCSYNGLTDCNNIEVGQTIKLPTREEIAAGATATPGAAATTAPAATPVATATPAATVAATSVATTTTTVTATATTTATTEAISDGAAEATATPEPEAAATSVKLVAALEAAGSFTTLVKALTAAGLTEALDGVGPYTIFAPTDAAFAELPAGALDKLLENPSAQLTQILLFHVLSGKVMSSEITNGMSATTQEGKAVTFEVVGGIIKINGAVVSTPDIEASNGVIHAIDAVILPPP